MSSLGEVSDLPSSVGFWDPGFGRAVYRTTALGQGDPKEGLVCPPVTTEPHSQTIMRQSKEDNPPPVYWKGQQASSRSRHAGP